jgi:hypothetical protein
MLTVKLMKFSRPTYSGGQAGPGEPPIPTTRDPGYTEAVVLHPAEAVFVECSDKHGRQVIGVQSPKTGEIERFTIGDAERDDVMFNVAYVMNEAGRTVETVR